MRRHLANRALAAEVCQVLITIVATSLQMRVVGVYAQQLVAPGTLKRGPEKNGVMRRRPHRPVPNCRTDDWRCSRTAPMASVGGRGCAPSEELDSG